MESRQIILLAGLFILMIVFYTNENTYIELATGIPLLGMLMWSIIVVQKSNVDSKIRRNSLVLLVVIASVLGRLYFQITQ